MRIDASAPGRRNRGSSQPAFSYPLACSNPGIAGELEATWAGANAVHRATTEAIPKILQSAGNQPTVSQPTV